MVSESSRAKEQKQHNRDMDAKAFFDLTARMRDAQKGYFSTPSASTKRKQEYLTLSKKLEAELDREIKRVRNIVEQEKWRQQNPTFPGFDVELLNRQEND